MTTAIDRVAMMGPREIGNPGLRQSLSSLLEKRWSNYRKALQRCRKEFSEKSVHALRVEIRRVLSLLTLLGAVLTDDLIAPIRAALQGRLKAVSRLRDTQVQVESIRQRCRMDPGLLDFQRCLQSKERRLVRRLSRELEESGTSRLTRRVRRLRRAVAQATETARCTRQVEAALHRSIRCAYEKVEARYRELDPATPSTIHRLRIAFKTFRYMVESMARIQPGVTARQLRALRAYQARMGGIQDVEVLLARTKKFAQKPEADPLVLEPFEREIVRLRARLVKRFMASANRLEDFRPRTICGVKARGSRPRR